MAWKPAISKVCLQGGTSFVDLLCFCSVLCLLCFVRVCLYVLCVVTCWERADLLALVCGVYCEFVTFPLVSWVRCGTWLYRFLIFAPLLTLIPTIGQQNTVLSKAATNTEHQNWFQNQLSLNACQKYCRMLQGEHSAILLTIIKLPFFIKTFGLSILSGG